MIQSFAPYNKITHIYTPTMERAKTLICEALDSDFIGSKEVSKS